jgi:hypothetical protein
MVSTRIFTEPAGLVVVEFLEREEQRARTLDDLLHRLYMLAGPCRTRSSRAGSHRDPRHARGELGAPQDFVGVGAVRRGPHVSDIKRVLM